MEFFLCCLRFAVASVLAVAGHGPSLLQAHLHTDYASNKVMHNLSPSLSSKQMRMAAEFLRPRDILLCLGSVYVDQDLSAARRSAKVLVNAAPFARTAALLISFHL